MFIRRSVSLIKFAWMLFFMALFLISYIQNKASNFSYNENENNTKKFNLSNKNISIFEINKLNFELINSKKHKFGINKQFMFTKRFDEDNDIGNDINFLNLNLKKIQNEKNFQKKILYRGWLKFMEITEDNIEPPKNFFINKKFYEKENTNNYLIPDKYLFYFELTIDKLSIYDNFSNFRKRINDLKIKSIGEDIGLQPCKGGIEKIGSFKEGYCFIIKFTKMNKKVLWEMCSEKAREANKWIQSLQYAQKENFKIKTENGASLLIGKIYQIDNSVNPKILHSFPDKIVTNTSPLPNSNINRITTISPEGVIHEETKYSNELWLPIENWSTCSKPCGGGLQTRKYICKDTDKCSGESLRKRQCNLQICKKDLEEHISNLEKVAKGKWEYLGNWSPCSKKCGIGGFQKIKRICVNGNCVGESEVSKPCNIIACQKINKNNNKKDGNSKSTNGNNNILFKQCKNLIGQFNLLNGEDIIPTIVEVNLKNIEFYRMENSQKSIITHDMKPYLIIANSDFITFENSRRNDNCIKLHSTNKSINNNNIQLKKNTENLIMEKSPKIRLCNTFNENKLGNLNNVNFCQDWMKRFNEFKKKCSNQIMEKMIKDIEKSVNSKINTDSLINKISKKLKGKKGIKTKRKEQMLDLQFEEFKKQAEQVLKKENSYEKSLIEQEKQRLECEDKKLNEEIKNQEIMAKKLLKEIKKEKKSNTNFDLKQKMVKREMKNILNNIDSKISEQRISMLNNLQKLRTEHDSIRKKAVTKLVNLKKNLGKAILGNLKNGKGDPKKCFSNQAKNLNYRKDYCYKNFVKSKMLLENCLKESQFCYTCCDSEMQLDTKENLKCCYSKCDSVQQGNKQCNVFYNSYHIISEPLRLFD